MNDSQVARRYTGRTSKVANFRVNGFIHLRLLRRNPFGPLAGGRPVLSMNLLVSHDPGSGLAGVLFVKESYVVPADVQYEARTTNPLQFSGLKFGVNLRHDKCTVVPNRVHSVANLRNSFFRHADSFPSPDSCATPVDFKLHPTKMRTWPRMHAGNRFPTR